VAHQVNGFIQVIDEFYDGRSFFGQRKAAGTVPWAGGFAPIKVRSNQFKLRLQRSP